LGVEAEEVRQPVRYSQPSNEKARIWNSELIATSSAVASLSALARSLQIRTIAMHRARPTMMRPVRYSG
jgi:hypothetical protein